MNFPGQKPWLRFVLCAGIFGLFLFPPDLPAHGDTHEQIDAVSKEIAAQPNRLELWLKRAELHRVHGEFGLALADCQTAEKLEPNGATVQYFRGKTLFDAGLYPEAVAALDRFLAVERESSKAFLIRARVFAKLRNFERAAADFSDGIRFAAAPEPDYFTERAQAWDAAGKTEAALSGLDEGIARFGPVVSLQTPAIDLELKLGRYEAALKRVDSLSAQSSRKESWLLQRAKILERAGRSEEARVAYANAAVAIERLPGRIASTESVQIMQKEITSSLQRMAGRSPQK